MPATIPLFPLHTVLYPGGVLPLRIFEPRYVGMVGRCMSEGSDFGVILIREGREAGGPATVHAVGTLARIVDFDRLADGLLGITCRGEQRFRVQASRRLTDGLNVAEVEMLPPEPAVSMPQEYVALGELLRQILPQLGELQRHHEPRWDDAGWVGARIMEFAPLPLADKQRFLETDDPIARLEFLRPMLRKA